MEPKQQKNRDTKMPSAITRRITAIAAAIAIAAASHAALAEDSALSLSDFGVFS